MLTFQTNPDRGKKTKIKKSEILNLAPKDLFQKYVPVYIGTLDNVNIFYDKVIVIKVVKANNFKEA